MTKVGALVLAPLVVAVVAALLVVSAAVHVEAPYVRATAEQIAANGGDGDDGRKALSTYYSEKIGTVLFLVRTGNSRSGGIVIRATENTKDGILPLNEKTYETTCLSCDDAYWHRVIMRDGYVEMARISSRMVVAASMGFFTAMGVVVTYLSKRGYSSLGKKLQDDVEEGIGIHLNR